LSQIALMKNFPLGRVAGWLGAAALFLTIAAAPPQARAQTAAVTNRVPLAATPFAALPLGSVRPGGWLLTECQMQRDGLTGNAEAVYASDLGSNSAWLGGTGENWERGPYYLKGLVALAYTLDDAGLKKKAQKWIDWLLGSQRADGSIGPLSNNDWWPRMLATYALRDYYEATADSRVPGFLDNYLRYMLASLPARPLSDWGKARAGDQIDTALWLYNRNGDTNLLALAALLRRQAYDWIGIYRSNSFDWFGTDYQPKHNVNVEQALKFPAVGYEVSRDPADVASLGAGLTNLMREDGLAFGINSGTEWLSGNSSVQGVELCSIVEAMLSLETDEAITGAAALGDRLEMIAFNALPAALANEIKGIEYYTLPNNATIVTGGHGFNQDYANGTVPGPESGYPCCRYNFHMGWPKYVQHAWAQSTDGGLAALAYGPTTAQAILNGQTVQVTEDTGYPFEEQVRLKFWVSQGVSFPLSLRIPAWCANPSVLVNGQAQEDVTPGSFCRISRTWAMGDTVTLNLPMTIQTHFGPSHAVAINRGPLVYSLRIGENWTVSAADPLNLGFNEYHVSATTPWNYALALNPADPGASLTLSNGPLAGDPFNPTNVPVVLTAQARQLPDWTLGWLGTHAFEPPWSPTVSTNPIQTVALVPFGSQHLRISWFPYLGDPRPDAGVLNESFDDQWTGHWTTFGGNWYVLNHMLHTAPGSGNGAKAVAMGSAFTNVTLDVNVSVGPVGDAGLIFRASKPDIGSDAYFGYYAGINAANAEVEFGYASNSWHPLATIPLTIVSNTPYHLRVVANGPRIRVYVQDMGTPMIDMQDAAWTHGMVGVRDYCTDPNQSSATFADFNAEEMALSQVRLAGAVTNRLMHLTIDGAPGPNYLLYGANGLGAGNWTLLMETNPIALPVAFTEPVTNSAAGRFYRVQLGP